MLHLPCPGPAQPSPWAPHRLLLLPRVKTSLLQDFWCQPASLLPREPLSALIRGLAAQRVSLRAWQVSLPRGECMAQRGARLAGGGLQAAQAALSQT